MPTLGNLFKEKDWLYDTEPRGGFPKPTVANNDPNVPSVNNTFSKGEYLDYVRDSEDGGGVNISEIVKEVQQGKRDNVAT